MGRTDCGQIQTFKQKEQVKSRGGELRGADFIVNYQFLRELLERCKVLFPIRKSSWREAYVRSSLCMVCGRHLQNHSFIGVVLLIACHFQLLSVPFAQQQVKIRFFPS